MLNIRAANPATSRPAPHILYTSSHYQSHSLKKEAANEKNTYAYRAP